MKKIITISLFLILFVMLNSCSCPCDTEEVTEFVCSPRETTITEFNSSVENPSYITKNGDTIGIKYEPIDKYSIHSFLFPNSRNETGILLNEKKFNSNIGIDKYIIDKIPLSSFGINLPFYVALMDDYPPNKELTGDWLIDTIVMNTNPNLRSAQVRIAGWITSINLVFNSESSNDYCHFIENNFLDNRSNLRNNLTKYGKSIGAFTTYQTLLTSDRIYITNDKNQILGSFTSTPLKFNINIFTAWTTSKTHKLLSDNSNKILINYQAFVDALKLKLADKGFTEINVKIGDVFYYRAKNGKDFIISIINIDERDNTPVKKRLSIMFNEL